MAASILSGLSDRARHMLSLATRVDSAVSSVAELLASLSRVRAPVWPVVVDAHAELSRVDLSDRAGRSRLSFWLPGWDAAPGPAVLRDKHGVVQAVRAGLLTFAAESHELFMDERGRLRTREGDEVADSIAKLIEKLAMKSWLEERRGWNAAFAPNIGVELAQALGAVAESIASDSIHHVWVGDAGVVIDGASLPYGSVGETLVWTSDFRVIADCLEVCHRLGGKSAGMEIFGIEWQKESRPAVEAPEPWGAAVRHERKAVRTLSREPGSAGYWGVIRSGRACELAMSIEHDGVVLRSGNLFADGGLLFDYADPVLFLRSQLSDTSAEFYEKGTVSWDFPDRVNMNVVHELCASEGVELLGAWETFERAWGGLRLGDMRLGIYHLAQRGVPPRRLIASDGARVLGIGHYESIDLRFFMDERGRIYADGVAVAMEAVAESWTALLERLEVAGQASVWPERTNVLEVDAVVGAPVAAALGVPVRVRASDQYARVWLRNEVEVYERDLDIWSGLRGMTTIVTRSRDDLVEAMRVVSAERADAGCVVSPVDVLPEASHQEVVLRLRRRSAFRGDVGEIRVHGWRGNYLITEEKPSDHGSSRE